VLVAAGIAFYENEQIREWFNESRRKLAVALHSLGDEINPQSASHRDFDDDPTDPDARRRRREEIIRQNRLELVKRAREEGVAVDLDELTAIGKAYDDETEDIRRGANRTRSFDDIVGSDGKLRTMEMTEVASGQSTGASTGAESGVRLRGAGTRGLDTGSTYANPFIDEMEILYDLDEVKQSRESSRTLSPAPLVDVSDNNSEYFSEEELEAQIQEAIRRSISDISQAQTPPTTMQAEDPPTSIPAEESFYYAPPPNLNQPPQSTNSLYASAIQSMLDEPLYEVDPRPEDDDDAHTPAGTLTPTEDGFSTIGSMASGGDDVGALSDVASIAGESMHQDEMMSEAGYASEFSMVGASTPGSWTDVESEAGEEEGHSVQTVHNPASHT
jgi:hypothetical protein